MAITKVSRSLLSTGVSDSSDATAITIDSSENVGIGGSPVPSNTAYNGAALHIRQAGTGSAVGSQIHLTSGSSGHAAGDGSFIAHWGDSNLYINNQENANIITWINGAERMRIDASGNVGITAAASLRFNSTADNTHAVGYDSTVDLSLIHI